MTYEERIIAAYFHAKAYLGHNKHLFTSEGGKEHARKIEQRTTTDLARKVERAAGPEGLEEWICNMIDTGLDRSLEQYAAQLLKQNETLPPILAKWLATRIEIGTVSKSRKRGRTRDDNRGRDAVIYRAVYSVCHEFGLRPYRGIESPRNKTRNISACAVVSSAAVGLGFGMITESNVEKIFQKLTKKSRKQ